MNNQALLVFGICILAWSAHAVHGEGGAAAGFVDQGVGAGVAESRGVVATRTSTGRYLVIANGGDLSPTGYVLVTDIDTGETKQHFCPEGTPSLNTFASLMARSGKFYTTKDSILLEFDPVERKWTFSGKPSKDASLYLSFTEGPDGTVWAGGYGTNLVSFDPKTRTMKDHGRMDPSEKYLSHLAVDSEGWVYGGIGTARFNIVACNPRTGLMKQLLKEEDRRHGTARVYPGRDGAVYGIAGDRMYRLLGGKAEPVDKSQTAARRDVYNIGWGERRATFPDGRRLTVYDIVDRWLEITDPKTGDVKRIEFDYESEGAMITSLGAGPNAIVYGSTCHPMRFLKLDTANGKIENRSAVPFGGGNFCSITRAGNLVLGAEYPYGRLCAYDVTAPWLPWGKREVKGIAARELVEHGECTDGHFTWLKEHDVAFFRGDKSGAEGRFILTAPDDGKYYVHVLPYKSKRYCTVQFLFDGGEIGGLYPAKSDETEAGELIVFGPFDLQAGEHVLAVRTIETPGQEPWCAVVAVALSHEKLDRIVVDVPPNPRVLAEWRRDICRPRTVLAHPDGRHAVIGGYAGYGLCGGGLGIHDLKTGKNTLLKADEGLLPGHSTITLKALPGGDLVGGTSIDAPGGGHTTAREAELYILDWKTKKVAFRTVPVAGDRNVVSLEVSPEGLVFGLSSKRVFFVFDPEKRAVIHREDLSAYGSVPRHAFQLSPDGTMYALMRDAILRIRTGPFGHEKLAQPPVPITAGGALVNGRLYFAGGTHVWSYVLPSGKQ